MVLFAKSYWSKMAGWLCRSSASSISAPRDCSTHPSEFLFTKCKFFFMASIRSFFWSQGHVARCRNLNRQESKMEKWRPMGIYKCYEQRIHRGAGKVVQRHFERLGFAYRPGVACSIPGAVAALGFWEIIVVDDPGVRQSLVPECQVNG